MVAFAPVTIVAPTLRNYQDSETGIAWLKDERRVGTGTSWLSFPTAAVNHKKATG